VFQDLRTGNFNTAIGAFAAVTPLNSFNSNAIGYFSFANASNKVRIGNNVVTAIEGAVPYTTPSDGRFKYQVQEDIKGLDFIMQLRPVTYQFDAKRFDEFQKRSLPDSMDISTKNDMHAAYEEAASIRRTGFIAQEVEKAALELGFNFSGLIKPKNENEYYSLSYESFVVPLTKAIQELYQKTDQQAKEIAALRKQLKSQHAAE
jgi:hypothetical protein